VTVCDRGGEDLSKVPWAYTLWTTSDFKRVQLHKYNILMFNKF